MNWETQGGRDVEGCERLWIRKSWLTRTPKATHNPHQPQSCHMSSFRAPTRETAPPHDDLAVPRWQVMGSLMRQIETCGGIGILGGLALGNTEAGVHYSLAKHAIKTRAEHGDEGDEEKRERVPVWMRRRE